MNYVAGVSGFACGAALSLPVNILGGVIASQITKSLKFKEAETLTAAGIGGAIGSIGAMLLLNSSPFETGAKVSLAAAAVLSSSLGAMAGVTTLIKKQNPQIQEIGSFSLETLIYITASVAGGSAIALLGSALFPAAVSTLIGSTASYYTTAVGVGYSGAKHGWKPENATSSA